MATATAEQQPTEGDAKKPATGEGAAPPPNGKKDDEQGAGSSASVLADLAKERDRRQALEAELEAEKSKHKTEHEKALDEAKKAGAAEAELAANRRIVRSEVKAAAGGKVSDPEDAAALLGDLDRFIVKGEVDTKAIAAAIDELVKSKPYLAASSGKKPAALPGGGKDQAASGSSFNDEIRRRIHRGG